MLVSVNIEDKILEKKIVAYLGDKQEKLSDLMTLALKEFFQEHTDHSYRESKAFEEDKAYFHKCLENIESGKIETISHDEVWSSIKTY